MAQAEDYTEAALLTDQRGNVKLSKFPYHSLLLGSEAIGQFLKKLN